MKTKAQNTGKVKGPTKANTLRDYTAPHHSIANPNKKVTSMITQVNHIDAGMSSRAPLGKAGVIPSPGSAQGFYKRRGFILPEQAERDKGKKTLVLDLDETLVHSSFQPVEDVDVVIPVEIEKEIFYVYVLKRPGAEKFLEEMSKYFEVVIYTASLSIYADPLLDKMDPKRYGQYRLFREHCTFCNNTFVKDLSQLGREMKDIIIVDNSPSSYIFQPENAVPISTWIDDMEDRGLFELSPILKFLSQVYDVRPFIRKITQQDTIDYVHALKVLQLEDSVVHQPIMNNWITPDPSPQRKAPPKKSSVPTSPINMRTPLQNSQVEIRGTPIPTHQKKNGSVLIPAKPNPGDYPHLASTKDPAKLKRPKTSMMEKKKEVKVELEFEEEATAASKHLTKKPHQPRQTPLASKKIETPRPATPQTTSNDKYQKISGKKISNPLGSKKSTHYSNLIKIKEDLSASKQTGLYSKISNKDIGHSYTNSVASKDWLMNYDNLRRELNMNSPKDVVPTKVSAHPSIPAARGIKSLSINKRLIPASPPNRSLGDSSNNLPHTAKHEVSSPIQFCLSSKLSPSMEKNKFCQMLLQFNSSRTSSIRPKAGYKK